MSKKKKEEDSAQLMEAHIKQANALFKRERYAEALNYYALALKQAPDDPMLLANKGLLFSNLSDLKKR